MPVSSPSSDPLQLVALEHLLQLPGGLLGQVAHLFLVVVQVAVFVESPLVVLAEPGGDFRSLRSRQAKPLETFTGEIHGCMNGLATLLVDKSAEPG